MDVGLAVALTLATSTCPTLAEVRTRVVSLKTMDWEGATSEGVAASALRTVRTIRRDEGHRLVSIGWIGPRTNAGGLSCAEGYSFAQPQATRADHLKEVEFSFRLELGESADGVAGGFQRLVGQPKDAESFTTDFTKHWCFDCGNEPSRTGYRWREGEVEVRLLVSITNDRLTTVRWSRTSRSRR